MTAETEFVAAADRALAEIATALDAASETGDADIDWTLNDGILEIDCGGGKLIVNRHVPNREIWVAARSGGFHFAPRGGFWRDTRSGDELASRLTQLLRSQAGVDIALPTLRAPA